MDSADEYVGNPDIGNQPHMSQPSGGNRRQGQRTLATVYDAVAGRVTYDRVLRDEARDDKTFQPRIVDQRDSFKLAPDDVLFRRKDAPERYAEHDIYRAHEWDLPNGGRGILPQSDLLMAIHEYTSEFYGTLSRHQGTSGSGRNLDECSMDETALLAFGILLEEAGREVLGRRGHLVFTEGTHDNNDDNGVGQDWREGSTAQESGGESVVGHNEDESSQAGRKRRKLTTSDDE
ncbi:hypothetical protein M441DRAFT_145270 [Trichoderma asperellum CBS 433.97]|uniref:Uncharacterized protein n=1 Tax=Trichoderma asperellum (strain ATCC 204424 / CBS 433.97 / NBRC 101777) TaxID=1042311 RepID=A0A2T3Z297_TRIA4|nr:hypothetical protein M441DRAFT_145270 [Trichoderma asperellum CBS 433.97]PTB38934.1 hypothetical protein M441DRAFT_145270 [Trichoderma asperellum CBS 433.97]